jgi:UPF0755 protein
VTRNSSRTKTRPKRRRRGSREGGFKRVLVGLAVLVLLLMIPVGMVAWSWWKLQQPYRAYVGEERIVAIEPGLGASQILQRLESEGVIEDADLARTYLIYRLGDPKIQAGEYRFRGPMTTPAVLAKLVRGDVITHGVTIVEGLTLEETAEHLAAKGFGRREAFLEAMRSPEPISELDPEAGDLEGYLFPETYSFASGTTEAEIVAKMVATFRTRWDEGVRPILEGGEGGRSVRELVTLASLVEKEAQVEQERPLIAGVYANRLRRGIGLAADPTVIFALKLRGAWDGNIRREDLRIDSPYNTYRYAGLPPGPIASPGLASLRAAAEPADVPYLYFVSRNDGTHVFAETLAEHNRNVERWQRQYWRERRAEERRRQAEGNGR